MQPGKAASLHGSDSGGSEEWNPITVVHKELNSSRVEVYYLYPVESPAFRARFQPDGILDGLDERAQFVAAWFLEHLLSQAYSERAIAKKHCRCKLCRYHRDCVRGPLVVAQKAVRIIRLLEDLREATKRYSFSFKPIPQIETAIVEINTLLNWSRYRAELNRKKKRYLRDRFDWLYQRDAVAYALSRLHKTRSAPPLADEEINRRIALLQGKYLRAPLTAVKRKSGHFVIYPGDDVSAIRKQIARFRTKYSDRSRTVDKIVRLLLACKNWIRTGQGIPLRLAIELGEASIAGTSASHYGTTR